jgi:hypothetical protein
MTEPERVELEIVLCSGDIARVATPFVVCPHYEGLPLAGAAKAFDRLADCWLARALELGMISLTLGRIFPIALEQFVAEPLPVEMLLLVGMGEPGAMTPDDLRFLFSNVTIAVEAMGGTSFASALVGTRRKEFSIETAVRAFVEGVLDGHQRLIAIAAQSPRTGERLTATAKRTLSVMLVIDDERKFAEIEEAFGRAAEDYAAELQVTTRRGEPLGAAGPGEEGGDAEERDEEELVTLLRVTRRGGPAISDSRPEFDVYEFSAACDRSVVTLREHEISRFLLQKIPERLIGAKNAGLRDRLARFLQALVAPRDFGGLLTAADCLTVEVDEAAARIPWEMMAHRTQSGRTRYLGGQILISRQMRSASGPPPSSPPPLNRQLRILVVADPAAGELALPRAREEGWAVVEMIERACRAWEGVYDFRVTIRVGSAQDGDQELERRLGRYAAQDGRFVESAAACEPVEIAMLLVDEQFDLVHYAGHGFFDEARRSAGWVLDRGYRVTARELFCVRQVPRLVFANACYSSVVPENAVEPADGAGQRSRLVGAAQAFFARGIPNYIGAGWPVDDYWGRVFAEQFYARALGLSTKAGAAAREPDTIGKALLGARRTTFQMSGDDCATWAAYQHYGRAQDRLLASAGASRPGFDREAPTPGESVAAAVASEASAGEGRREGDESAELVYFNGVDAETGRYAVAPMTIAELGKIARARPNVGAFAVTRGEQARSFGLPPGVNYRKIEEAGWGVIFFEEAPRDVADALKPLLDRRKAQAGALFKTLSYKRGEETREWRRRYNVTPGSLDPQAIPYYLLIVGPPDQIPFEFQYLLGVDFAVGRLAFDQIADYERYAASIVAYEEPGSAPINGKEVVYWGTRHPGDEATELSATELVTPLAQGVAGATPRLATPVNEECAFAERLLLGDDATKAALVATLRGPKPPAVLFTASHGMEVGSGRPRQREIQGALLCQDWQGFGRIGPDAYLAAADVPDDANVRGLIAFFFACFGGGTPELDQFLLDPDQAGRLQPLAPQPFIAALPQRLLGHPGGGALAVVAHIDRAWGYSIRPPKSTAAQIGPFRESLHYVMRGEPVGHAVKDQFGGHFASLSTTLLSAVSPTAAASSRMSDKDLVAYWLQRNDAQNYVTLGDPAARLRVADLT